MCEILEVVEIHHECVDIVHDLHVDVVVLFKTRCSKTSDAQIILTKRCKDHRCLQGTS